MNQKREERYVLDLCSQVLDRAMDPSGRSSYDPHMPMPTGSGSEEQSGGTGAAIPLVEGGGSSVGQVDHICGVIDSGDKAEKFRATLFRLMRSNVVTTIIPLFEPVCDPVTGEKVMKSVFISFFTSEQMKIKAHKICLAYNCHIVDCPRMSQEQLAEKIVSKGLRETDFEGDLAIIRETEQRNVEYYWTVATKLKKWSEAIKKEKAIFAVLNKFKPEGTYMVAECWIPKKKVEGIKRMLRGGAAEDAGYLNQQTIDEKRELPTYFATNKYTGAFQGIVNAYGVAHYNEINPTLFALSIFPFLFGVMFGDLMHGTFLLLFSVICIVKEDTLKNITNEMFVIPFGGRYLLFIMSICAIYMGFIYNEVASVPLDLFGTAYVHNLEVGNNATISTYESASLFETTPYTLGVDPVWRWSSNNVQFTNSMKMKMAIILGVIHMTLGVILKAMNKLHFGDMISFINESIPEVILFMSVFGYLVILIFIKWGTNWNVGPDCWTGTELKQSCLDDNPYGRIQYPRGPPMIITTLIDFAFLGNVKHKDVLVFASTCEDGPEGFCPGQTYFQNFLLALAGLSMPWLLLVKPFMIKKQIDADKQARGVGSPVGEYSTLTLPEDDESGNIYEDVEGAGREVEAAHDDEHNFAEIFIHQVIHTIEYGLGTVSNTASYLRLWALSLAHSQLSEVFWDMIFVGKKFNVGLNGNTGMLVICWFLWFGATMAVLMVMESLSAFLHALRLQWVEFQNKFYQSDGSLFIADSFEEVETE